MIRRQASQLLVQMSKGFPIVALTGPRQSGKTTLARQAFPDKPYFSLEDPEVRQRLAADPKQFFAILPSGAVLDEVQRCPEVFSYLQGLVDERARMGEFVITGSQQFGLLDNITQSLAGRVGLLQLLPLSLAELTATGMSPRTLEQTVWMGGYPALFDQRRQLEQPAQWLSAYASTYIERDVRQVLEVSKLSLFQRFVLMSAARTGQLLNLSALAADCGISHTTARSWLTVLEASYVVYLLQPYHQNFGKRLVKMPKLYFLDTGLAAYLTKWPDADSLEAGSMSGAILETWLFAEILKSYWHNGLEGNLFFYRDTDQREVDLLIEVGDTLYPVEFKKTASPSQNVARQFSALDKLGKTVGHGAVICLVERDTPLSQQVTAIPAHYL